jgi:protein TonB
MADVLQPFNLAAADRPDLAAVPATVAPRWAPALAVSLALHGVALLGVTALQPAAPARLIDEIPIEIMVQEDPAPASPESEQISPTPASAPVRAAAPSELVEPIAATQPLEPEATSPPPDAPLSAEVEPNAPQLDPAITVAMPEPAPPPVIEMERPSILPEPNVVPPKTAPPAPVARHAPARPTPPRSRPVRADEDDKPTPWRVAVARPRPTQAAARQASARPAARTAPVEPVRAAPSGPSPQAVGAYRGLVLAELNRRKSYPDSARASGAQGRVVVSFTVGPAGRVVNQSVTVSSGNGALDAAARSAVQRMALPAPPGGRFSGSAVLRFALDD